MDSSSEINQISEKMKKIVTEIKKTRLSFYSEEE